MARSAWLSQRVNAGSGQKSTTGHTGHTQITPIVLLTVLRVTVRAGLSWVLSRLVPVCAVQWDWPGCLGPMALLLCLVTCAGCQRGLSLLHMPLILQEVPRASLHNRKQSLALEVTQHSFHWTLLVRASHTAAPTQEVGKSSKARLPRGVARSSLGTMDTTIHSRGKRYC